MATGNDRDRYAPLREQQPEAPNKSDDQAQHQEAKESRAVEEQRPPIWTEHGGMVEQQQSANDMIKYHNAQRANAREEPARDGPAAPEPEEKKELSFYEDKARSRADLKIEHSDAVAKQCEGEAAKEKKEGQRELTFYEDRVQEQDQDRSR